MFLKVNPTPNKFKTEKNHWQKNIKVSNTPQTKVEFY